MTVTPDERRALAFIAAILLLSAAVRVGALPEPGAPGQGIDLDAHIAATADAVAEEERRSRPLAEGETIDPNRADADELNRLPGVGPAIAARIVQARRDGRFHTAADLTRVPGIGPATVARLTPHLRFPPAAHPGPADMVDINAAGADELTRLPGVGPVLAARIVAFRDSAGSFPAVDSLLAVKGIGPATLERIRPLARTGRYR
ncbi:MAG: ComEA family DNA-binding protein [Gemmatimonadota bacterium]